MQIITTRSVKASITLSHSEIEDILTAHCVRILGAVDKDTRKTESSMTRDSYGDMEFTLSHEDRQVTDGLPEPTPIRIPSILDGGPLPVLDDSLYPDFPAGSRVRMVDRDAHCSRDAPNGAEGIILACLATEDPGGPIIQWDHSIGSNNWFNWAYVDQLELVMS